MRYMRGGTLAAHLEKVKQALPLNEVIALIEALAPTLDAMHKKGVIHRDLKPSNILYDEDRAPYIADFGIARIQQATTRYTQTGMSFGTLQYSSPEQVTGEVSIDYRSDIYTLGVIIYELLTGEYPFWSDTPLGWVHKHAEAPIPNVREVNRTLPAGLTTLIQGMLAKSPEDRYSSVQAVVEDLKRAEAGKSLAFQVQSTPVAQTIRTSRPSKTPSPFLEKRAGRNRVSYWLAGGAILLVMVAIALLVLENGGFGQARTAGVASPTSTVAVAIAGDEATLIPPTETSSAVVSSATVPPATATRIIPPTETVIPPEVATAIALEEAIAIATAQAQSARDQLPPSVRGRNALFAPYAATAPTLDGDLSDWEPQAFQELSFIGFRPENVSDPGDLSAACTGRWTDDSLYLACHVLDDTLVQTSSGNQLFRGDGVELLFDVRVEEDVTTNVLDEDDFQLGVVPGGAFGHTNEVYRWYPQAQEGTVPSIMVAGLELYDGYQFEIRIPWGIIDIQPHANAAYGFGMSINDNDSPGTATQESQLTLFANQKLIDPTSWGLLVLVGEP